MRKLTTSLMGLLFLVVACNKQDTKAPDAAEQDEQTSAITQRKCATNEVLEEQLAADPSMKVRMQQIEAFTQQVIKNPSAYRLS